MTFRVGQKVVCVDDAPKFVDQYPYRRKLPISVKKGEIYTISGVVLTPAGKIGVYLLEVKSAYPPFKDGMERTFLPERFRPVVERKTDISIFTAMLNPSKQEIEA